MRLSDVPHLPFGGPPPLWPPLLATRGPGARSTGHSHHAMHLVLGLDGPLRMRAADTPWTSLAGVLTAPDVPHSLDAEGRQVLLVFLDPESEAGAALAATLTGPFRALSTAERDMLAQDAEPSRLMGPEGVAWTRRVVEMLGAGVIPPPRSVHPRVRRVLRLLHALPPGEDDSLATLAAQVGLSPGRLMHAFTESIGLPLRPYLAWLRLQRAATAIVSGMPLGEAAQAAGFADSAHMSRTFRRMLGMPPSALRGARRSQLVQDREARRS
ncbi:AraC family transcriptional regulator [Cystobacter fuscus]|nr:AraC family transcriptional regulator [Cystobacter fuscus]